MTLALDLEWDSSTILCAATAWIDDSFAPTPQLWALPCAQKFVPLSPTLIDALIDTLYAAFKGGTRIVTWGGTGTDWKALLKASPHKEDMIKELARGSIDIPLVSVAHNGMMQSLVSTAYAMGLVQRSGCDLSADVPKLWAGGIQSQMQVLDHVQWDAWATAQIFHRLHLAAQYGRPQLTWSTQRSGLRSVRLQRVKTEKGWSLPSVSDVMTWPVPVCKFSIPDHLHPLQFTSWLKEEKKEVKEVKEEKPVRVLRGRVIYGDGRF